MLAHTHTLTHTHIDHMQPKGSKQTSESREMEETPLKIHLDMEMEIVRGAELHAQRAEVKGLR